MILDQAKLLSIATKLQQHRAEAAFYCEDTTLKCSVMNKEGFALLQAELPVTEEFKTFGIQTKPFLTAVKKFKGDLELTFTDNMLVLSNTKKKIEVPLLSDHDIEYEKLITKSKPDTSTYHTLILPGKAVCEAIGDVADYSESVKIHTTHPYLTVSSSEQASSNISINLIECEHDIQVKGSTIILKNMLSKIDTEITARLKTNMPMVFEWNVEEIKYAFLIAPRVDNV